MTRMLRDITIGAFLAFTAGYFYGGSALQITHFQRDHLFQEVRDDYFRKCELGTETLQADGYTEESYSCPRIKLFLLKRYSSIQSQSRGGAQ